MGTKSMYFASANPALGERFRPRWRRHAALAMSKPPLWDLVDRYCQYDPVGDPPAAIGATSRYDAIGMTWFSDIAAFAALEGTETMNAMRRDEMEIFGLHVRQVGMRCEESILKDLGRGQFKVFCIFGKGEAASQSRFEVALREELAAAMLSDPVLDSLLTRLSVGIVPQGSPINHGRVGLLELSFDSLPDAAAFFSAEAFARIAAGERTFAMELERCIGREVLLDDRALLG